MKVATGLQRLTSVVRLRLHANLLCTSSAKALDLGLEKSKLRFVVLLHSLSPAGHVDSLRRLQLLVLAALRAACGT